MNEPVVSPSADLQLLAVFSDLDGWKLFSKSVFIRKMKTKLQKKLKKLLQRSIQALKMLKLLAKH